MVLGISSESGLVEPSSRMSLSPGLTRRLLRCLRYKHSMAKETERAMDPTTAEAISTAEGRGDARGGIGVAMGFMDRVLVAIDCDAATPLFGGETPSSLVN